MATTDSAVVAARQEILKVLVVAFGLVFVQLVFSVTGLGGLVLIALLYASVIITSTFYQVDITGFTILGKDALAQDSNLNIATRIGINVWTILLGLIVWMLIGTIHGVEVTVRNAKKPEDVMQQMVGSNLLLKLLYAFISHITLFSFCRFWVNLVHLLQKFWKGDVKGR